MHLHSPRNLLFLLPIDQSWASVNSKKSFQCYNSTYCFPLTCTNTDPANIVNLAQHQIQLSKQHNRLDLPNGSYRMDPLIQLDPIGSSLNGATAKRWLQNVLAQRVMASYSADPQKPRTGTKTPPLFGYVQKSTHPPTFTTFLTLWAMAPPTVGLSLQPVIRFRSQQLHSNLQDSQAHPITA